MHYLYMLYIYLHMHIHYTYVHIHYVHATLSVDNHGTPRRWWLISLYRGAICRVVWRLVVRSKIRIK